ncbi:hypothetical protein CO172_03105 [Candidatus Uhrbacteria bacterium CG_4_9_14_3_um_filter_36_7]|uniref:GGDEF domain-containing protein n=1 Tax=Candidatus Uhrbacteria bacterium CG_4_9_14_3_um_filter_36_7 TaxID=1975033 RepID=A0A2M7XGX7_9BACT|nr:MAG: hypothetical protein CO172_03105 [Candidatus Uhrbacteria bacterium CG_4_9_14_3_um_filter_36_7]
MLENMEEKYRFSHAVLQAVTGTRENITKLCEAIMRDLEAVSLTVYSFNEEGEHPVLLGTTQELMVPSVPIEFLNLMIGTKIPSTHQYLPIKKDGGISGCIIVQFERERDYSPYPEIEELFSLLVEARENATVDVLLTSLFSRRHFSLREFPELKRRAERIAWVNKKNPKGQIFFLIIDLDNFKKVNDTYGHPVGDSLLQITSRVMTNSAMRGSDILARLGGDELVIAGLEGIEAGRKIAKRIIYMIPRAVKIAVPEIQWDQTVSIGIAVGGWENRLEDFITHADRALYQAKKLGRNRYRSRRF